MLETGWGSGQRGPLTGGDSAAGHSTSMEWRPLFRASFFPGVRSRQRPTVLIWQQSAKADHVAHWECTGRDPSPLGDTWALNLHHMQSCLGCFTRLWKKITRLRFGKMLAKVYWMLKVSSQIVDCVWRDKALYVRQRRNTQTWMSVDDYQHKNSTWHKSPQKCHQCYGTQSNSDKYPCAARMTPEWEETLRELLPH